MIAIAPGKLILSGEHAVVYGRPALAMAIDRCAQSIIAPGQADLVSFNLLDLKEHDSFTLRALGEMHSRLLRNYQLFLNGELGIRDVLHKPIELFEFAFITLLDGLRLKFGGGIDIQTQSNIPIGCGMGSSAATVLSMLRAIGHYFRVEFRPDWFLKYSMDAEKLQHGFPSGVDSYISLHGGCALFRNGEAESVPLPRLRLYLVNTGTPTATTGECVVEVKNNFANDPIWNDFEAVTLELEKALRANDHETFQQMIGANQRLLERIGVVPEKVQHFAKMIEATGGAAKICGAGSVLGDNGGLLLVIAENPPVELCREYGYELLTVRGDPLGARIV
ncbi:MAG: mevalonate kinase [Kiritimatiellae bacterium]|nr:mevalonate kinase [Kiritimatiellia bacterium]